MKLAHPTLLLCARLALSLVMTPRLTAAEPVAAAAYRPEVQSKLIHRSSTTADGAPIQNQSPVHPEVSAYQITIPRGANTGWHIHPVPEYAYVISGELTLTYANGVTRVFKAGEAFAEAVNTAHNGRNTGREDVHLVVFIAGEAGGPSTLKTPEPVMGGK